MPSVSSIDTLCQYERADPNRFPTRLRLVDGEITTCAPRNYGSRFPWSVKRMKSFGDYRKTSYICSAKGGLWHADKIVSYTYHIQPFGVDPFAFSVVKRLKIVSYTYHIQPVKAVEYLDEVVNRLKIVSYTYHIQRWTSSAPATAGCE